MNDPRRTLGSGLSEFMPEYTPDVGIMPVTPGAVHPWQDWQVRMLHDHPEQALQFDKKFGLGAGDMALGKGGGP